MFFGYSDQIKHHMIALHASSQVVEYIVMIRNVCLHANHKDIPACSISHSGLTRYTSSADNQNTTFSLLVNNNVAMVGPLS